MAAERPRLAGLYALTPEGLHGDPLVEACREALAGGARLLQYRAKAVAGGVALADSRALAALCREHGATFIVNDSIELALAVGADGIHLGRDDESPRAARIAMPRAIIGVSCYDQPERARAAAAAGADYVAIGSLFPSGTKPRAVAASLGLIATAREAGRLPVCGIGGITVDNAAAVVAAGADMVAVIGGLFSAADVERKARTFAALFPSNQDSRTHV